MELAEIGKKVDEIGRTQTEFVRDNDERLKAIEEKGHARADLEEKVDKIAAGLDDIETAITEGKAYAERLKLVETALERQDRSSKNDDGLTAGEIEWKAAVEGYVRSGGTRPIDLAKFEAMDDAGVKAMVGASNPDGGYALTTDMEAGIESFLTLSSPMRSLARVISTNSRRWKKLYRKTRFTNGGWVAEQAARTATDAGQLGEVEIVAHGQYAYPEASEDMLEDADFSIEPWILENIEEEMVYTENTAFCTGTGVGQPRGFATYTAGTDPTAFEVQQVNLGHATLLNDADGLISLQDALNPLYDNGASWAMETATRTAARKLVDGQGNYLLIPDYSQAGASLILGKPVTIFEDMASIGANALAVAYANWMRAYLIVDRRGTSILRDPYSNKPNVGFYVTKRVGGGIVNPQAIKIGKIAA